MYPGTNPNLFVNKHVVDKVSKTEFDILFVEYRIWNQPMWLCVCHSDRTYAVVVDSGFFDNLIIAGPSTTIVLSMKDGLGYIQALEQEAQTSLLSEKGTERMRAIKDCLDLFRHYIK